MRQLSAVDRLISLLDQGLKVSFAPNNPSRLGSRPLPQPPATETHCALDPVSARTSAALMRINHAGEVAAQALYYGQALVAKTPEVRTFLLDAAREEGDHLSWCATRLAQLNARPSLLNPFWFTGAFAIGAIAGLAGDRLSLGFITETERQVEAHLSDHLSRLPPADDASRAIIEQMKADEIRHGQQAHDRGGQDLPTPIRQLMSATSRIMTLSAGLI